MKNPFSFLRRFSLVLTFVCSFGVSQAAEPEDTRQLEISRQMNCVESMMGQSDSLNWQDVCFFSDEEVVPTAETAVESVQPLPERDNRDFMFFKRRQVVDRELDDWEAASKHHYEMGKDKNWTKASEQHFSMDKTIEEKEPIVSDKFARENLMPGTTRKHTLNTSTDLFYAKYVEPDVMEQRGVLWGASGSYTYRPNKTDLLYLHSLNMYQMEGMVAAGKFNYEAEAASQAGLQIKDKDDFMFELRGILGREYVDGKKIIGLYSGVGYRYLNDDDDGELHIVGSSGFYGYERESNYIYIPIGASLSVPIDRKNSFTIKGEYDAFIFGWQVSHLSDGNPYLSLPNEDVTNDQKRGFGLRGSIQFLHNAERWRFSVEPFFRFWNIEDSEVVRAFVDGGFSNVLEPENKTFESGVRLGVEF